MILPSTVDGGSYVVRRAVARDVAAAADVLAEAFAEYPWTTWTVEATERQQRLVELYGLVLGAVAVPHGLVWVCEERGEEDRHLVGAAAWLPSTADVPTSAWEGLAAAEARLRGDRLERAQRAEAQVQPLRPHGTHWMLGTLGVRPAHRGRGLAGRLLAPGLEAAAATRAMAYLETSERRNVALYQRFGFEVAGVVRIDGDGPTVWAMRRPA